MLMQLQRLLCKPGSFDFRQKIVSLEKQQRIRFLLDCLLCIYLMKQNDFKKCFLFVFVGKWKLPEQCNNNTCVWVMYHLFISRSNVLYCTLVSWKQLQFVDGDFAEDFVVRQQWRDIYCFSTSIQWNHCLENRGLVLQRIDFFIDFTVSVKPVMYYFQLKVFTVRPLSSVRIISEHLYELTTNYARRKNFVLFVK